MQGAVAAESSTAPLSPPEEQQKASSASPVLAEEGRAVKSQEPILHNLRVQNGLVLDSSNRVIDIAEVFAQRLEEEKDVAKSLPVPTAGMSPAAPLGTVESQGATDSNLGAHTGPLMKPKKRSVRFADDFTQKLAEEKVLAQSVQTCEEVFLHSEQFTVQETMGQAVLAVQQEGQQEPAQHPEVSEELLMGTGRFVVQKVLDQDVQQEQQGEQQDPAQSSPLPRAVMSPAATGDTVQGPSAGEACRAGGAQEHKGSPGSPVLLEKVTAVESQEALHNLRLHQGLLLGPENNVVGFAEVSVQQEQLLTAKATAQQEQQQGQRSLAARSSTGSGHTVRSLGVGSLHAQGGLLLDEDNTVVGLAVLMRLEPLAEGGRAQLAPAGRRHPSCFRRALRALGRAFRACSCARAQPQQ